MKALWKLGLLFLAILAGSAPGQAREDPVKIALVSNEKTEALRNVLTLAETQLSEVAGIHLLERQAIDRVLAEQKLNLSGLVATEQAIVVGKLLGVDLFAVLEAGMDKKEAAGLVVFDARTGVRLHDAAMPAGDLDKTVAGTVEAVKAARQKRRAIEKLHPVCLMTVRNADLPRNLDPFCESVGLLLERRLVASPDLALLERSRLEQINKERNLPVDSPLRQLLASVVTIELEIGVSEDKKGLRGTALLSDGQGKSLGKAAAVVMKRDAAALAEAVFAETARALNAKPTPAEGARVREAWRFFREAEFLWEHKDPRRALRAAESAHALEPGDPTLLVALTRGLLDYAIEVIDPGGQNSSGTLLYKMDPAKLDFAVALAQRGAERLLDVESLPPQMKLTPSGNVHKALAARSLYYFLQKAGTVREGITEDSRAGLAAVRVSQQRIHDLRFDRAAAGVHDKATFDNFSADVNNILFTLLEPSVPDAQWAAGLVRLNKWADLARKYEDVRSTSCRSVLSRALQTYRFAHKPDQDRLDQLRQFWAELEKNPNLTIAVYARQGSLTHDLTFSKVTDDERRAKVHTYRLFIQDQLEKGPKEPGSLRLTMYLAAADGIDLLRNRPGYVEETKELCDFMLGRKELAPTVAQHTAFLFQAQRKPDSYRYAYAVLGRALDMVEGKEGRFLTYAESPMVLQIDRDRFRKEFRTRQNDIRQAEPSVGPKPLAPWEKVITLIDVQANKEGIVWVQRPVVHEGAVYTAGVVTGGKPNQFFVQLLKLTPVEGGQREGKRAEVSLRFQPWAGTPDNPFRLGINFGTSACVHQNRYYLGTKGHGIFALPFDDGEPERITAADGLPSDEVQALACMDGRLYAYLGERDKDSYVVAWDLKARKCEVLASSRRKEKRSPFDDNTPLVTSFLLPDPARGQVLISVFSPFTQHALNGVWALDVKKDTFRRLFILHHADLALVGPGLHLEGDRLVMPSMLGTFSFDLTRNDQKLLLDGKVALEVGPTRSAVFSAGQMPAIRKRTEDGLTLRPPFVVADGWLWAGQPFARRTLDGGKEEMLAPLRRDQKFFQPTESLQRFRGERELLAGDSFGLWVIVMPKAPGEK
jgi:hypothetical protein